MFSFSMHENTLPSNQDNKNDSLFVNVRIMRDLHLVHGKGVNLTTLHYVIMMNSVRKNTCDIFITTDS